MIINNKPIKDLKRILFISRHEPTEAQRHLFACRGYELIQRAIVFPDAPTPDGMSDIIIRVMQEEGVDIQLPIAGVFPIQVVACLADAGFTSLHTYSIERGVRVDLADATQLRICTIG